MLYDVLDHIRMTVLCAVVLENVTGICTRDRQSDLSPLSMILRELSGYGYHACYFSMNLASWHEAVRKRTSSEDEHKKRISCRVSSVWPLKTMSSGLEASQIQRNIIAGKGDSLCSKS